MNLTSQIKKPKPSEVRQQIRQNYDTGVFSIIKEVVPPPESSRQGHVMTRSVYSNGEDVRERMNHTTGVMNFS